MQCPVCDVALSISSREGVEIDFCPQCRGVWLDRGELDKVIERASTAMATAPPARSYDDRGSERDRYGERPRYDDRDRGRYDDRPRYDDPRSDDRRYDERYDKKRRKRSFLDDIFDFD